ncbi:uncharacterized protein [Chironomus tepperi]|uniref:uncharacterized protein isoform X3 n=1 Tax=Chironomus tepperi TaxID=113505 RepID=UPI00391F72BF
MTDQDEHNILVMISIILIFSLIITCVITNYECVARKIVNPNSVSASPQTRTANQRQSNVERAMPRPRVIEESSRRPQSSVTSEAPVLYYCVPVDLSGRQHQPIIRYLPANADPVYPLPTTAPPSSSTPQNQQSVQNSSKSQKVDDLPSYDEALRLP